VSNNSKYPHRGRNLALAAVASQVGITTVVLIMGGLFLGLWLDSLIGVRGPFTILLLIISAPISLYLVFRMALGAARGIQTPQMNDDTVPNEKAVKED
jgi:multisubunit Na+/H+ antiporter MnhG subunit